MFMPKEVKFFDLFDKQAENLVKAAEFYKKLTDEAAFTPENVRAMHELEHYGDELTHNIINTLNETFITPFDREDILALANRLDDIIDGIYLITNRFQLYKITKPTEYSQKLANTIAQSTKAMQKALASLRSNKNMKETLFQCVEINRLENEGDVLRDEAISWLFENEKDPIMVIKQKELFEEAETVTDFCEYVANLVESILVKNN
ncbi:DUF47 family protein [Candidatus Avelusimicrobium faecicola]|uniref:DUF47 domain-containing protein n=1 Tax=Candidatus Avelusimicrobium faecicola TaxID=3416205 RepID=UPI00159F9485|nr:DUF47 family protein [Spirochaetota bacterium]MDE3276885.1 DUF47 family protein [Spirochaetota bacterium]MDY2939942.1 DUF47 family protein [Elusimicrobiaceae bacterium]MDY6129518.1 DUF47 family protein [Elusimicrobiaceae bacterium]